MRLIVIGAGPGGYETAAEAASRGLDVTLVTDGPLGGTCLNEGCIPTKALIHSKALYASDAVARKDEVVQQLRTGIASLLRKVRVVNGKASFVDAHSVKVGDEVMEADRIIIATGSRGARLPVPGAELASESGDLLKMTETPSRLVIIGGGVIGLEFAGIFKARGSEVTVLEYCANILPRFDIDIAKRLKQSLVRSGINIVTSAQVTGISKSGDGVLGVQYQLAGESLQADADCVLMAVGRRANTEGLNLEAAGVEYGPRGIVVDGRMRTSVPDIYAVGDVTGGMMLAHVASFQGLRALNDITGVEDEIDFSVVPAAVFTEPELATVGMTEEDCKAAGIDFKAHKAFYRANGKAVASDCSEGCCKLLTDCGGRIIGCHILGAHASDIIHEAATLVALGVNIKKAGWLIHAHPTLSEVLQAAIRS